MLFSLKTGSSDLFATASNTALVQSVEGQLELCDRFVGAGSLQQTHFSLVVRWQFHLPFLLQDPAGEITSFLWCSFSADLNTALFFPIHQFSLLFDSCCLFS